MWIIGGLGFLGSLMAFSFSFIPPGQIAVGSPAVYVGILVGGAAVMVLLPFLIYAFRKPHWRDPSSAFVPFTWQIEHTHPGTVTESSVSTQQLTREAESSGSPLTFSHGDGDGGGHGEQPGHDGEHAATAPATGTVPPSSGKPGKGGTGGSTAV